MGGETLRDLKMQWPHRDGRTLDVMYAAAPIPGLDARVGGAVYVAEDVTDKLKLERQLAQSQKMEAVGQLTGGIAHDFNNILTVITGTIEILHDEVADRPQLAAVAKMIDAAATRGAELTKGLLAFARKQPLQPRETDLNYLVVDLLFTDVVIPGGMNGRQLADEIAGKHPSIKVLYTSGYTQNAIVHQGRLDPGVLLLGKPYRKMDLARMVRAALD